MLPQVAQGALAVECRTDDDVAHRLLAAIEHGAARAKGKLVDALVKQGIVLGTPGPEHARYVGPRKGRPAILMPNPFYPAYGAGARAASSAAWPSTRLLPGRRRMRSPAARPSSTTCWPSVAESMPRTRPRRVARSRYWQPPSSSASRFPPRLLPW